MAENTTLGDMVFAISEKYNLHLGVARNIVHGYALEIIAAAFNANANLNDFMNALTTEAPAVPAAKVEAAPVAAKANDAAIAPFGTVLKLGTGYMAQWFNGTEFQNCRDFATRKEANAHLRSMGIAPLSSADYQFPSRRARRYVSEQRKTQK